MQAMSIFSKYERSSRHLTIVLFYAMVIRYTFGIDVCSFHLFFWYRYRAIDCAIAKKRYTREKKK